MDFRLIIRESPKFYLWGGFLALLYIRDTTKHKDLHLNKLNDLDLLYYEDLLKLLRVYVEGEVETKVIESGEHEDALVSAQRVTNIDNCTFKDISFPQ